MTPQYLRSFLASFSSKIVALVSGRPVVSGSSQGNALPVAMYQIHSIRNFRYLNSWHNVASIPNFRYINICVFEPHKR